MPKCALGFRSYDSLKAGAGVVNRRQKEYAALIGAPEGNPPGRLELHSTMVEGDCAQTDVRESEDRPYGERRFGCRHTQYRRGTIIHALRRNGGVGGDCLRAELFNCDDARTDVRQSEDRPYGFPLEDGDMRGAARSSTAYGGMEESVAIGARTDLARANTVLRVTVGRW